MCAAVRMSHRAHACAALWGRGGGPLRRRCEQRPVAQPHPPKPPFVCARGGGAAPRCEGAACPGSTGPAAAPRCWCPRPAPPAARTTGGSPRPAQPRVRAHPRGAARGARARARARRYVEVELADGDAHALHAQVAEAEHARAVRHDDDVHALVVPVVHHRVHVPLVRAREVHPARAPEQARVLRAGRRGDTVTGERRDGAWRTMSRWRCGACVRAAARLQANLADGGRVDDGRQLLHMLDDHLRGAAARVRPTLGRRWGLVAAAGGRTW